jgi:hypothetical protein
MQVIYYTADIYFPLLVIKGEVILNKISWEGRKKSLCSVIRNRQAVNIHPKPEIL